MIFVWVAACNYQKKKDNYQKKKHDVPTNRQSATGGGSSLFQESRSWKELFNL
jgi:hypothetical protein